MGRQRLLMGRIEAFNGSIEASLIGSIEASDWSIEDLCGSIEASLIGSIEDSDGSIDADLIDQ